MSELTPSQIVEELDKYIVGQDEAKRKVAVALRNRWRRRQLPPELRDEVSPKNIIMIGPTGVGKTEIARRLSKLAEAPFIKVEASKFTEVGYVGRDCESMIRELIEVAVKQAREEMNRQFEAVARAQVEKRLMDLLMPPQPKPQRVFRPMDPNSGDEGPVTVTPEDASENRAREIVLRKLQAGDLEDREIDVEVRDQAPTSMMQVFSNSGLEEMGVNVQEMLGRFMPQKTKRRKVTVAEARRIFEQEVLQDLVDQEAVVRLAIERAENDGIIFLDEIDKIAGRSSPGHGPDVSREGVQRDILPIVEGSTVVTKYGPVKTDHILFIAAGAFHMTKVSDLIPELQGRFPIRVELQPLRANELSRILREPKTSLLKQYEAMMQTEGVNLLFSDEAVEEISRLCQQVNDETENIGARRLHTVMEYLLESISFDAPGMKGQTITLDHADIVERLSPLIEKRDLSRYIL